MKLYSAASALAVLLLATSTTADRPFEPKDGQGKGKIKSKGNFGNDAKIELCPTGDCDAGQVIRLKMRRLEEVTADGKPEGSNKAQNFEKVDATWSAFANETVNGVTVYSSTYTAKLNVGPANANQQVDFTLKASIYPTSGTANNGKQLINIPAGGLKFTLTLGKWPFKATTNKLQFGVSLEAQKKGKKGGEKPTKGAKNGTEKVARINLSEGMFIDSPDQAVLDDVDTAITSAIATLDNGGTELYWQFPSYTKTLFYDPVIGSEDTEAKATDAAAAADSSLRSDAAGWALSTSLFAATVTLAGYLMA